MIYNWLINDEDINFNIMCEDLDVFFGGGAFFFVIMNGVKNLWIGSPLAY